MAGGHENRTEKPTPRRLQKAREKGQVARSKEVGSVAVLLGVLLVLHYYGGNLLRLLKIEMRDLLTLQVPPEMTTSYISTVMRTISIHIALILGPVMLTALVIGIGSSAIQGGVVVSWQAIGFHFEKLNPKNGLGRIFSKNGIVELVKSLCLVVLVSIISYRVVSQYLPLYPRLVLMDVGQILYWAATITFQVFIRIAILLAVIAAADYAFQKRRLLDQLKMTKQEIKEEFKETEGDPLIRGRIRRIQRELARKRMMTEVPKADVVITNPTHYAVALSYKVESMEAPQVIAKGVGFLALKIKELAQQHNIPMVENRPLAQTLYKTVDVGESIPASLYRAVAEILAYVYKAKAAWK